MNWFENEQIFLRIDELKWELMNKIKNYQIDLRVDWPRNWEFLKRIENKLIELRITEWHWDFTNWFEN